MPLPGGRQLSSARGRADTMADRSAALAMAEYKEKVEELETDLYEVSSLPPGRVRRRVLLLLLHLSLSLCLLYPSLDDER